MTDPILGSINLLPETARLALIDWEQAWLDELVSDMFGFHAVQLGAPEVRALRTNRMPHRWLGLQPPCEVTGLAARTEPAAGVTAVAFWSDFDALPFPSQSLDLVVMMHALEGSREPHLALREVERVLVPEGRLVVLGFNPASLWGLRHRWRKGGDRPEAWIGYGRLRDWLRLLGFEVDAARFGLFRPPMSSPSWMRRLAWLETAGQRWWPVLGAVYGVSAVKRVRGMRLVGLARRQARYANAPRPVAVSRQRRGLR